MNIRKVQDGELSAISNSGGVGMSSKFGIRKIPKMLQHIINASPGLPFFNPLIPMHALISRSVPTVQTDVLLILVERNSKIAATVVQRVDSISMVNLQWVAKIKTHD